MKHRLFLSILLIFSAWRLSAQGSEFGFFTGADREAIRASYLYYCRFQIFLHKYV